MLVLDWRSPQVSCGSLGNIVAQALVSEYVREELKLDAHVIPSDWHRDVWPLCVTQDRILTDMPKGERAAMLGERKYTVPGWFHNMLNYIGVEYPEGYKINPRVCWYHSPSSRNALLYPREYDNKNSTFTLEYWSGLAKRLRRAGWRLLAILDREPSHRDGMASVDWCKDFLSNTDISLVLPPTIGGLQAGVGLSEVAIGRMNGPGWLMLKSTIRQIALDDPNDPHPDGSGQFNVPFMKKPIKLVVGTSLDWTSDM